MKFKPISEKEAMEAGLWPRALHDFEVIDALEKVSRTGNDMIELNVAVFNSEGTKHRKLFDYLVDSEKTQYKVRHFASATGLLKEYEAGELKAEDCKGKTGRCQLAIKAAENGYPAKNVIADYIPVVPGAPLIASKAPEDYLNDSEIPF